MLTAHWSSQCLGEMKEFFHVVVLYILPNNIDLAVESIQKTLTASASDRQTAHLYAYTHLHAYLG